MVAQDVSLVAIESLGSEMILRLRMGFGALDWRLSWDVRILFWLEQGWLALVSRMLETHCINFGFIVNQQCRLLERFS